MRQIKTIMVIMASLGTLTSIVATPVRTFAAPYYSIWKKFWERLVTVLVDAAELYLETVIRRGYFKVSVPGAPIINAFNNQADASAAAQHGLVFDGSTLTVPQDIVLHVRDRVGVALQQGEYPLDGAGNFQFNLIRVQDPAPSPTFPIPKGSQY